MRAVPGWRWLRWAVAGTVAAAGVLVVIDVTAGVPTYPVTAVFPRAPGLFAGAAVEVLGVKAGTVTSVRNVDDTVMVGLAVDDDRPVPAGAVASLVSPELLGEPDIELGPGYTAGPRLAPGSVIPESRTEVPISTDQLLKSLGRTLRQLNPRGVGDLISSLAQDLDGQGAGLNRLIAGAAGTLQLLADKGDDLGRLDGSLAELTGSLDSQTSQLTQLITDYDTVSGVIAQHRAQLGDSITQLASASTKLVTLLEPNLAPLEQDVGTVTTAGRTLDRNLSSVNEILSSAKSLFSAAQRAYDPAKAWLNLNLQLPLGVTGDYVAGLVRDRLAGVCRRIAANHSAGLSSSQLQTLAACGDPSSGFFDPLLSVIPTVLQGFSAAQGGASAAPSPSSMLQQGLSKIPGVGTAGAAGSGAAGAGAAGAGAGAGAPGTSGTGAGSGSPGGSAGSGSGGTGSGGNQCPILGSILTCTSTPGSGSGSSGSGSGSSGSGSGSSGSGSGSAGSGSSGSGGTGSGGTGGGLGGLLSTTAPAKGGAEAAPVVVAPAVVTPAVVTPTRAAAPSLRLPSADTIHPLSPSRWSATHRSRRHRGVLSTLGRWAHDAWSWL